MRLRYPKSFLKLVFVGFSLVALPLIFGLVNNAISIDRLANQSQDAVYQAVQATQTSRMLAETITSLERIAGQFLVLGDQGVLDGYAQTREKFLKTTREFSGLPLSDEQRARLKEIIAKEKGIFEKLTDRSGRPANAGKINTVIGEFAELSGFAETMMVLSHDMIDREANALQQLSGQAQRIVIWQLLALIPVVLFLVAGFIILIARPIRQLDQGIRRLGNAEFNQQIVVSGPQDLENLGRQLDWLRLRLVELEEQKAKFLRHVSHELKTPLTALREGSELLSDEVAGSLNPQQQEIVRILQANSIQLQKLIRNLLEYSAVQFHKSTLDLKLVKVRDVVERATVDQKLAVLSKELALSVACVDATIEADEEKLRVMVDNLLSNAIKFSPQGGTITITVVQKDSSVVLDMIDTGPGIAAADWDRVFDPFYQGQAVYSGPVKGSGLGLSIVKEHVTAHGGRIEIIDDVSPGAHFRVSLPRKHGESLS